MDRKHDLEKVWMTKDLFHFNLCGTDGYKARLEAINEANKKIQTELAQRLAGTNYKVNYKLSLKFKSVFFFRKQLLIRQDMPEFSLLRVVSEQFDKNLLLRNWEIDANQLLLNFEIGDTNDQINVPLIFPVMTEERPQAYCFKGCFQICVYFLKTKLNCDE